MKIRLVCCAALLGLLISPAMATITVTLEAAGPRAAEAYANIPWSDAIVGFDMGVAIAPVPPGSAVLTYGSFAAGPLFDGIPGDGIAAVVPPLDPLVYGTHVLLGTISFNGSAESYVTPVAGDGFALPGVGQFAQVSFGPAVLITPEPASMLLLALGVLALRRR